MLDKPGETGTTSEDEMSREVRRVPADWQHPRDASGRYVPLLDQSYDDALSDWETDDLPKWLEGAKLWAVGFVLRHDGTTMSIADCVAEAKASTVRISEVPTSPTYQWWAGDAPAKPSPDHYMPSWPEDQRTHLQMYEDTSEGTPISPVLATAEELARWLADNKASAFAGETATYEQWLAMIHRGSSIASCIIRDGRLQSGVAAVSSV